MHDHCKNVKYVYSLFKGSEVALKWGNDNFIFLRSIKFLNWVKIILCSLKTNLKKISDDHIQCQHQGNESLVATVKPTQIWHLYPCIWILLLKSLSFRSKHCYDQTMKILCFFLWVYNKFTSAVYFTTFSYNLIPKKCRGWGTTWKWPVLYTGLKNLRKTRNSQELGPIWEGSMHIGWSPCTRTSWSPHCQSKTKKTSRMESRSECWAFKNAHKKGDYL